MSKLNILDQSLTLIVKNYELVVFSTKKKKKTMNWLFLFLYFDDMKYILVVNLNYRKSQA